MRKFVKKFFGLILVLIMLGRFYFSFWLYEADILEFEGMVKFKGCIVDEVDVRKDKVKYVFGVRFVDVEGKWQKISGKVLVNADRYPLYTFGECFLLNGWLEKPQMIEDFDYGGYLSKDGIFGVVYKAKFSKWAGGDLGIGLFVKFNRGFFSCIYFIKGLFESKLFNIFNEPGAGLMNGLLLGSRKGIGEELMLDFKITGLTHILAVSGFNITLMIGMVNGMLGFLSRKKRVIMACVIIFCFVMLVGASAAVVRAGIMGGVALMAVWFGRQYFAEIALWVAGFLMVLWNPRILFYDVGFQLSFLATAGLIYVGPRLKILGNRWLWFLPDRFGLRETFLMTVAAQSLALPVILINFKQLSLVSLLANPLVLPFIPVIMLLGFVALVVGFFWNFGGMVLAFLPELLIKLVIFIIGFLANFPMAAVEVGWFGWGMTGVYYFVLVRWIRGLLKK